MSTQRIILVVDDDDDLRSMLIEQFAFYDEFDAHEAVSVKSGLEAVDRLKANLVIMDVGLPDMDGREGVKIMRNTGYTGPIIMLTGHDSDSDEILGLEAGANDYVKKPFRFAVLLARVRALLRQHDASEDAEFRIGPYQFRPSMKLLTGPEGKQIRLTEKETSILKYLYRAKEKSVPREELLAEVWLYNADVSTHTLETHIYRLRQKIEPDPANAQLLITDSGGYRLNI